MNLSDILSRLDGVRKSSGGYMACCPAHEDSDPSLRISDGGDRVLLHCFAGCRVDDVLTAIGLDWVDAFESMTPRTEEQQRLTTRDIKAFAHSLSTELSNLRAERMGLAVNEKQKRLVEQSRVKVTRFAERYGANALAHLVETHKKIYWSEA